jgi:hypothetical protein
VLKLQDSRSIHCNTRICHSCVQESKQVGRVFAGCDFRSVISQLCKKTSRVQTYVLEDQC